MIDALAGASENNEFLRAIQEQSKVKSIQISRKSINKKNPNIIS